MTDSSTAGLPGLRPVLAGERHPLVFATVSGAHLYGFPSRDSDIDLRGVHLLPVEDLIGLREGEETCSRMWDRDGTEMDLVTHDLRKFARLMLRRNGYVLEQLLSPLVVHTTEAHAELAALGAVDEAPSYLPELIEAKAEAEHGPVPDGPDAGRVREDVEALHAVLADARDASRLPDEPSGRDALHDLVVRVRKAADRYS